jgi:hypothetical protein
MKPRPLAAAVALAVLLLPSMAATADNAPPTAQGTDFVVAFMPPNSEVLVVSPSLDVMRLDYRPPASSPTPAVVRVDFGQHAALRYWDRGWSDPLRPNAAWLTVVAATNTPLAGTRADGTWTLVEAIYAEGHHPAAAQLSVLGKVFDDAMPAVAATSLGPSVLAEGVPGTGSEPIDGAGSGMFAADLSSNTKLWNWPAQAEARYDVGPVSGQNAMNPEQDPRLWTFRKGPVAYAPAGYASASDGFWAHLAPWSTVRVVSPEGESLSVTYNPLADGALCSNLGEATGCLEPAVIHVRLDGTVDGARQAYHPAVPVSLRRFQSEGDLAGQPADGTWTVDVGRNKFGLPAGARLSVAGKTFDDVDSSPGVTEIETTGTGDVAGGLVPSTRTWNWHAQAEPSHHAFLGSETGNAEYVGLARLKGASANVGSSAQPVDPGQAPRVPEKVKTWSDGQGNTYAFVDDDGDTQPDPNELQAVVPPVGAGVGQALPPMGFLSGGGWAPDPVTPNAYQFRVTFTGLVPPDTVVLVVDGTYYTAADAVAYPRGYPGSSQHTMLSQDPVTYDGALYTVTVLLQPGSHAYHFEAEDPMLRWTATSAEPGPAT